MDKIRLAWQKFFVGAPSEWQNFFVDTPYSTNVGNKNHLKSHFENHFTVLLLLFKIIENLCIFTCKKLDVLSIKNKILYSSGFVFDLGIIAT